MRFSLKRATKTQRHRGMTVRGLALALLLSVTPLVAQQPQPQPQQQDEFVPVSQLPAQDQLPAAPLLVSAYAFVWVALLLAFDVVFVTLALWTFEPLMTD